MPFYSPNNLENKNVEKLKKTPGDTIILQWCTKNHDYMLYCSWYMAHNRCNWYFSFWTIFCPFTSQQLEKSKFKKNEKSKKKKMPGYIIILQWCTRNHDHMLYCSWDIVHNRCNCYFSFWAIFCPFTSLTAQKIKILKKWKTSWRYYHFTMVYQNHDHMLHCSWNMVGDRCKCYFSF